MLPGLLPFLPLPSLILIIARRAGSWTTAVIGAFVAWGAALYTVSETLGRFHALTLVPVVTFWILTNAVLLFQAWRDRSARPLPALTWPRDLSGWCVAIAIALLLLSTLLRGFLSAPNAPDVENYHLPRQVMWLQQGSLDHFLTPNDRELMMPPLAELMQAHAMLLSRGDHWAAFPQWLAYVVAILLGAALVRELGGSPRGATLGALLVATLAPAYHQASSSKNDLLLATCLGCAVWFWLRLRRHDRWHAWLGLGLSAGLALGTKSTAVLWLTPLAFACLPLVIHRPGRAALALACAVALPLPHALRNLAWYGTPLGIHKAEDGGAEACERLSAGTVVSNLLREAGDQFATPSPAANRLLLSAVLNLHHWLGLDPEDRKTTLWTTRYAIVWAPNVETLATDPVLVVLALAAAALALLGWRRIDPAERALWPAFAAMVVLFALAIKWQPWITRLELPSFLIAAALAARALDRLPPWAPVAAGLAAFAVWIPAAETATRPLWTEPTLWQTTRWADYFRVSPADEAVTNRSVALIERARVHLLEIDNIHNAPYPAMRRLLDSDPVRIRFWGCLPQSRKVPPDAIWASANHRELPLWRTVPGARERYRAVGNAYPWVLYLPASRVGALASEALPAFIGWTASRGLGGPRALYESPAPFYVREMEGPRVMAGFIADGGRQRLQFSLYAAGQPMHLTLSVDAHTTNSANLPASTNWLDAAFALPPLPPGPHVLWLTLSPAPTHAPIFRRFRLLSP
ncbi:hypothetical protein GALL_300310 [mine drainage metagenome]|uniref:Glycosyltransferase RgtA/B/C/D-like domain-containing protein n=1 Tax=mine drainage metagenome TaxID=410659 RepID=A0A1J5REN1_9ZZZZ